jgi:hypothetical protein
LASDMGVEAAGPALQSMLAFQCTVVILQKGTAVAVAEPPFCIRVC